MVWFKVKVGSSSEDAENGVTVRVPKCAQIREMERRKRVLNVAGWMLKIGGQMRGERLQDVRPGV